MGRLLENKKILTALAILAIGITVALLRSVGVEVDQDVQDAAIEAVSDPATDAVNH